jgi:hypothetical protein
LGYASLGEIDMTEPEQDEAAEPEMAGAEEPAARGFGSQLLERAKKAKEQAHSSATGLSSKAAELKDHAAAKAGAVKDAGLTALLETLDDFNSALPVIREAGYALKGISVGIGLPPKVTAAFSVSGDVSAENVERVLAEQADKKLTVLLIKSLYQAWQVQKKIVVVGLKPTSISIEIGLIPSVSVSFE